MRTKTHDSTSDGITRKATIGMVEITLRRESWYYDPDSPLGAEGGFGKVFEGRSKDGRKVAIKELVIKANKAAHREMRMADQLVDTRYNHVIPVYDSGLDAQRGRYYVVMAKADRSLQDELDEHGKYDDKATASILLQIAKGLAEIDEITHRDLKPANILWHEGSWKIADFGIARFVEEATGSQTLKQYLSYEYAAPEQWRGERSVAQTDIYALGCIGYALLLGHPPFPGPNHETQHRDQKPPSLPGHPNQLRTLLLKMLSKAAGTRPNRERVMAELESYLAEGDREEIRERMPLLRDVGAREAQRVAEEEAEKAARLRAEERENAGRAALAKAGEARLNDVLDALCDSIKFLAPSAESTGPQHAVLRGYKQYRSLQLGNARLDVEIEDRFGPIPRGVFQFSGWDVIWGARIEVSQLAPEYKWGSSLWYTDLGGGQDYRWYEVSYYSSAGVKHAAMSEPHALSPQDADVAIGQAMTAFNVAFGPCAIDDEATDEFVVRWGERLALGVCPSNEKHLHQRVLSCSKTRYLMSNVPSKGRPSNENRITRTGS